MRPVRLTVGSQTTSAVIPISNYTSPVNVGVGVKLSAGASLTYTVEHTFDDVQAANFNPATATWYQNSGLTSQTASKDGNYSYPVTGVRLNVGTYASGNATITVIQAGEK